jgi:hypothetical protein
MGIADSFVNIGKGQITKHAKSFTKSIFGSDNTATRGIGTANSYPPGKDPRNGPGGQKILLYPQDIGVNARAANYILFTSHKVNPGKYKVPPKLVIPSEDIDEMTNKELEEAKKYENIRKAAFAKRLAQDNAAGSSTSLWFTNSTTESDKTIGLYMPAATNVSYNMAYDDSTIGGLTEIAGEAIQTILRSDDRAAAVADAFKKAGPTLKPILTQQSLKTLEHLPGLGGAADMAAIARGNIIVPRIEVMFRGISRRKFAYDFTFRPKNKTESDIADEIIKTFKVAMTPEFINKSSTRQMTIPDMFDIAYMHFNDKNSYLNKIGKCFLESADVTYGGDKWQTFGAASKREGGGKGAPPYKISLKLSFREIEIMDKQKMQDGY